jgi:hypothetical protein
MIDSSQRLALRWRQAGPLGADMREDLVLKIDAARTEFSRLASWKIETKCPI